MKASISKDPDCFVTENPADHILRLLQDDSIILDIVESFKSQMEERLEEDRDVCATVEHVIPGAKVEGFEKYPTSFLHQCRVLLRRSMYDTVKDRTKFARLRKSWGSVLLLLSNFH